MTDLASQDAGTGLEILEKYCDDYPRTQNAVQIFDGDWSSLLPAAAEVETGGFAGLFEDPRIDWMVEMLGGVADKRILELGPLEGGHTYQLETKHDAGEIVAIEANERAYLKCLISKEILETQRARFLLGDFNRYMADSGERFDLVVACGVLYHMENPAEHIKLLCGAADSVFVWSHYFDRELIESAGEHVAQKFKTETTVEFEGYQHVVYRQDYLDALGWGGFCGAGREYANWLQLGDIYKLFDAYGFDIEATGFEDPNHRHGPALAFLAKRR